MNIIALKEQMQSKSISAPELAKRLGVSKKLIYSRLKGQTEFKQNEIAKIAQVLNLNENQIIYIFFAAKVS